MALACAADAHRLMHEKKHKNLSAWQQAEERLLHLLGSQGYKEVCKVSLTLQMERS